ncbi:hypothetical protein DRP53_03250 [candidate division WOR-3 bacterium]|uniref:Segregation and condensation protein A n=1 Tax=candidate division WOR-3 bacterium TaxID=2052148 RepID=A0A660SJE7_UNCW3|nr:MAG: hypothetical protein DRP53_03250 [candidate division WOR-3 bacterium]
MEIDLGFYRGPLALLLYLCQKHEIDIMDVPIARITDLYLASIDKLDIDEVGEYLILATILVMMKLRAILKRPEEESEAITLERIAEEFQSYKDAVDHLQTRVRLEERYLSRPGEKSEVLPRFDTILLAELLKEINRRRRAKIPIPTVRVDRSEIEAKLERYLDQTPFVELSQIFQELESIEACIMLFLIILDWVMKRRITVFQEKPLAPVLLRRR